jgi:hypothetical protein
VVTATDHKPTIVGKTDLTRSGFWLGDLYIEGANSMLVIESVYGDTLEGIVDAEQALARIDACVPTVPVRQDLLFIPSLLTYILPPTPRVFTITPSAPRSVWLRPVRTWPVQPRKRFTYIFPSSNPKTMISLSVFL